MEKTKVLFIHQDIFPYMKETEMSLIGRNLPQGIQERGKEVRIFTPRFATINERRNQLHEVIRLSGLNLVLSNVDYPILLKVASIQKARMQIYFIDNDVLFSSRKGSDVCDKNGHLFEDNDNRMVFFSRGVVETIKKLNWPPDIIHCTGWFTAITPILLKTIFKDNHLFSNSKIIYTIYDDAFKEPIRAGLDQRVNDITAKLPEIPQEMLQTIKGKVDYVTLSKLAIDNADAIIFGSQKINNELEAYAKASGKPILPYHPADTYIDAYNELYDTIVATK